MLNRGNRLTREVLEEVYILFITAKLMDIILA